MDKIHNALQYLDSHNSRFIDELKEIIRIPSISFDPAHNVDIQRAAEWIAARLESAGLSAVEVIRTDGHPAIYGEAMQAGPDAPTVLIYGHYDVQSPEPLVDWRTPPFDPTVQGENLYGRGATDMKGQVMACVCAAEAVLKAGEPGVNIKFIIEGEEEIGSRSFRQLLEARKNQLTCDIVLNPDAGGMPDPKTPVIVYGLRGGLGFIVTIHGPKADLHSGLFGGIIQNPIHVLSNLISGLQDEHGRVMFPGFYDRVRPLDEEERAIIASLPADEGFFRAQAGVPALWGDPDFTPVERISARPSMDVLEIHAGQPKSAIPAKATATIAFRLVPDQDPVEIQAAFQRYIETNLPPTVTYEINGRRGSRGVITSRDLPAVKSMQSSLEASFGKQPSFQRIGGSIPAVLMFKEVIGVDSLLTGFSLVDDGLHGPNEKIHLPTWKRGAMAVTHFLNRSF